MPREIAELLGAVTAPGSFAVRRSAPADALRIEVVGVGPLELPIPPAAVRRLRVVAKPSQYGLGTRTLLDRSVRNSWEIAARRIRIDQRRWKATLVPLLEEIRAALGLAEGVELKAELHNMLMYERGHFFRSHQDSEKSDGMIGTLVVSLPSQFRGGELTVEQHGEVMAFRGSRTAIELVAFYADCRHEVRRVASGARVVLTYNLMAKGMARAIPPRIESTTGDALAGALRRHFETPIAPRYGGEPAAPDRLVYLLDHEYTARGLRWDLLKGGDAARAAALRMAAARIDCEALLAQADVHEIWECEGGWEDQWAGYRSRNRFRDSWDNLEGLDEDDDEDDGAPDDDPDVSELIDSDIELRSLGHSGSSKRDAIASPVRDEELYYTRPSADLRPFETEYTGFMGNWGNTLDRWYHRGAVVIWPRERTFVIRARASAAWALKDVLATLRQGKTDEARRKAESLLSFWSAGARSAAEPLLADALRVAAGLDDAALATELLRALPLEDLDAAATALLAPLVSRFGSQWTQEMLSALSASRGEAHFKWLTRLPGICEELGAVGDEGRALAQWLAAREWVWLEGELKGAESARSPSDAKARLERVVAPLLSILRSTVIAADPDLEETIVLHLVGAPTKRRVDLLMAILRAARKKPVEDRLTLLPLHELCTESLTEWSSAPARASDDWSIDVDLGCPCQPCRTLHAFLAAPDRKTFEWPLAKDGRAHIHQIIDGHELPVSHQTRRTGRPYTLVLTKRNALFERDTARSKRWWEHLAWLSREAPAFGR